MRRLLDLALLLALASPATPQSPASTFTLEGRIETSLARDLDLDGHVDLVLIGHRPRADDSPQRVLRTFPGGPAGPTPTIFAETVVPPEWAAVAFADWIPLPGVELLVFDAQGVRAHPLDPRREPRSITHHPQGRTLFEGPLYFDLPDPLALPLWPLVGTEANGLELWVPLPHGYRRLRRQPNGRARAAEFLDLSGAMVTRRIYERSSFSVERELPLPSFVDCDGDGVRDVLYEGARQRRLLLHLGRGDDQSSLAPEPLVLAAGRRFAAARETTVEKTFRKVADLNGDGRVDLLRWRVLGDLRSGMKFETKLSIEHATPPGQPYRFELVQEMLFHGAAGVTDTPDLNGDGAGDLVVARTESVARAALTGQAQLSYSLYLCDSEGRYPTQPTAEFQQYLPLEVLAEKDLRVGRLPRAVDLTHDFDGDGVADLFTILGADSLSIRRGRLDRRVHGERSWDALRYDSEAWFETSAPTSYRYDFADLDGDGRLDLYFMKPESVTWIDLP